MLLGYETISGELVVIQATRPGPNARRRWLSYEPDEEADRQLIADAYRNSGRIITYLGE